MPLAEEMRQWIKPGVDPLEQFRFLLQEARGAGAESDIAFDAALKAARLNGWHAIVKEQRAIWIAAFDRTGPGMKLAGML